MNRICKTPSLKAGRDFLWYITPQARARLSVSLECLWLMRVAVTLVKLGVRSVLV